MSFASSLLSRGPGSLTLNISGKFWNFLEKRQS
jgi:hypothetical protein